MSEPTAFQAAPKPTYLDLLNKRVETKAQRTTQVRVALDPSLMDQLDEARESLAAERVTAKRAGKMNNSGLDAAIERVSALEQQLLDTCLVITLHALTADDMLVSRARTTDKTPVGEFWKRDLAQAFLRAEDGNGHLVEDIGQDDWARLLEVIPVGELQTWHSKLGRIAMAPEFPTSAKS